MTHNLNGRSALITGGLGGFGLAVMLLLVGLASIIMTNARENQGQSASQAAVGASGAIDSESAGDPLADAGVVPDMPSGSKSGTADDQAPGGR